LGTAAECDSRLCHTRVIVWKQVLCLDERAVEAERIETPGVNLELGIHALVAGVERRVNERLASAISIATLVA
jgi:hypothetical protein